MPRIAPSATVLAAIGLATVAVPATAQLRWTPEPRPDGTALPAATYGHAATTDPVRGRIVLFGGTAGFAPLAETWERHAGKWIELRPAHAPTARAFHAMAWHANLGRIVLFGGVDVGSARLGDTWSFDGADWVEHPGTGPLPRWSTVMAADPHGDVILFGGWDSQQAFGDCYVFDGSSWTAYWGPRPPPRGDHAMAFDPVSGATVLFGGANRGGLLGDTWVWDGAAWSELMVPGPPPQAGAQLTFDPRRRRLVLVGDSTWEWDGSAWSDLREPRPMRLSAPVFAFDPGDRAASGRLVTVGGRPYDDADPRGYTLEPDVPAAAEVRTSPCGPVTLGAIRPPVLGASDFTFEVRGPLEERRFVLGFAPWNATGTTLDGCRLEALLPLWVLVPGVLRDGRTAMVAAVPADRTLVGGRLAAVVIAAGGPVFGTASISATLRITFGD